ncbi:hypothetical protein ATCC90586_008038 [Pythium insidiosum]|nr:hypothetical protein ATCC90586_008038 [Pythium insidiosum]
METRRRGPQPSPQQYYSHQQHHVPMPRTPHAPPPPPRPYRAPPHDTASQTSRSSRNSGRGPQLPRDGLTTSEQMAMALAQRRQQQQRRQQRGSAHNGTMDDPWGSCQEPPDCVLPAPSMPSPNPYLDPSRDTGPPPLLESSEQDVEPDLDCVESVLVDQRWTVHIVSHLYYFKRSELASYAHELVKSMRGHALMTYQQEYGYNVTIRFSVDCVAFQVTETRDVEAELLFEKIEQPQRPEQRRKQKEQRLRADAAAEDESGATVHHRRGAVVVYFPESEEDVDMEPALRPARTSVERGPETTTGATKASEPKFAMLLRGNEELMSWVCSWLQRRFQCVVGRHVVRVSSETLRAITVRWVSEAVEGELRQLEEVAQQTTGGPHHSDHTGHLPAKAPLQLKYVNKNTADRVQTITLRMPWNAVRRVYRQLRAAPAPSTDLVLREVEELYFASMSEDLAAMDLIGIEMDEVDMAIDGKLKGSHFFDLIRINY